jgi:hypothetical protein
MSAPLDLTKVDVDGAVREAADAVSGDTRLSNDPSAAAISPNGAFDKPATATVVLAAVRGTKFIVA